MSMQKLRFALDSTRNIAERGEDLENEALHGLVEVLDDVYESLRVEVSGPSLSELMRMRS